MRIWPRKIINSSLNDLLQHCVRIRHLTQADLPSECSGQLRVEGRRYYPVTRRGGRGGGRDGGRDGGRGGRGCGRDGTQRWIHGSGGWWTAMKTRCSATIFYGAG